MKRAIKTEIRILQERINRLQLKLKRLAKRTPKGVSDSTVRFVADFEGFYPEIYDDPAGYATIGFGHLIALRNATEGDRRKWGRISRAEGYRLLKGDLQGADAAVRRLVKVPLTRNQLSALTSFVFNVGEGAFRTSTLLRLLNSGEPSARVAEQFGRWKYANGKVLPGLVRRRDAEAKLFLKK